MSVTSRIRLVGAIATSIGVAFAVAVFLGVWASVDALPEILPLGAAGALIGMLVLGATSIGVARALGRAERIAAVADCEATQPLQPQTSYQIPNA